ncbi:MAG: methionine--tRNA ligase [Candidatus Pacebacteria bacterium]|nr:methionine--tRNA ligase [Candidatus Paceibacterota bacterium]
MSTSKQEKFYITTSIAYANAAPHIGYALEVVQADALARYHKLQNKDVFFLSGTDENGTKIKKTSEEKGMDTQNFVDENSAKFEKLLEKLNISNNDFIRTTDKKRHHPAAQKIWEKLVESGDIYKDSYEGYYCVGCEAYLTEKDLTDDKCPNHQKAPEKIKEENYFFRLSKYGKQIQEKIENDEFEILPKSRKNEILNVIKGGLRDVSFSRPKSVLDWGVPVPGNENQTMYVWCDALTNYISALGYGNDYGGSTSLNEDSPLERGKSAEQMGCVKFEKYWPADIHVIGKDILRFHAAIWPAMLLSAGLPLPKKLLVHGFITSDGQKISKSLGNIIDPFEVAEKYGVDALRYYLLKEIPSGGDGDFSFARFEEVYKSDLQNGLGNLTARTLTLAEKYFDSKVPEKKNGETQRRYEIHSNYIAPYELYFKEAWKNMNDLIIEFKLNKSLEYIISFGDTAKQPTANNTNLKNKENLIGVVSRQNKLIQESKPWELIKIDEEITRYYVYDLLESLRQIAWMIRPFLPETSDKIFEQLFADEKEREIELQKTLKEAQVWGGLKSGTKIKKGEILFKPLNQEDNN